MGALVLGAAVTSAVSWHPQASSTVERLRGVSAVSSTVAWASGNKGTVVRTVDADTAYALSIGPGDKAQIYKIGDSGARHGIAAGRQLRRHAWSTPPATTG